MLDGGMPVTYEGALKSTAICRWTKHQRGIVSRDNDNSRVTYELVI